MRIALIGYGKMGHTIEEVARERGHQVVCVIDKDNQEAFESEAFASADVAIEFTTPATAEDNIRRAWQCAMRNAQCAMRNEKTSPTPPSQEGLSEQSQNSSLGEEEEVVKEICVEGVPATSMWEGGLPVVCGTTGWDVEGFVRRNAQCVMENALVWSSNYSVGVNILFELNRRLAEIMSKYPEYQPSITEVHHVHKLDAPSGTAKTLQCAIHNAQCAMSGESSEVPITSIREGEVPGIHTVTWDSDVDTISISHSAKSRKGFALGAVLAAEWIIGKRGFHTMGEVLFNA